MEYITAFDYKQGMFFGKKKPAPKDKTPIGLLPLR